MEPEPKTEFMIYGVGEPEEPNIKVINSPSNEYDGLYEYKTSGSRGHIYVNEEKNIAIKINTEAVITRKKQEQEVEKQLSVKEFAPKIYWHGYYTIYMEDTDNIVQASGAQPYENIGVIIMEYLNPDEWRPIHLVSLNDKQIQTFLDALYKLVVTYKLTNTHDLIGNTGPHTFIKKNETYGVKFIDYANFSRVKGDNKTNKKDFIEICNSISEFIKPSSRFLALMHGYVLSKWLHVRNSKSSGKSSGKSSRKSSRKSSIKSRKTKFSLDNPETKASMKSKKKSKPKKHTKRKKKRKSKKYKMR